MQFSDATWGITMRYHVITLAYQKVISVPKREWDTQMRDTLSYTPQNYIRLYTSLRAVYHPGR
jgi:hypothetical protein